MKKSERITHEKYMRMALELALRGTGKVAPNPLVGAVIVDYSDSEGGEIVSCGWHHQYGQAHAEADAIAKAGGTAEGCTIYVNLEPCNHTGKTPPCSKAIIAAEITRVVAATGDINQKARGGIATLEEAGVKVITGILEKEARWLNRGFFKRVSENRPWVTIKAGMSLDGRIALQNRESKWITNAESRRRAHLLRAENDVIMVGSGTVLSDDPSLTVRDTDGVSPIKAVIDSKLATSPDARIYSGGRTLLFVADDSDTDKLSAFSQQGVEVVKLPADEKKRLSLADVLKELAAAGVNRLLIEGGAGLISRVVAMNVADEFSLFTAPTLMGGGIGVASGLSFQCMDEVKRLRITNIKRIDDNILIEGVPCCSPD